MENSESTTPQAAPSPLEEFAVAHLNLINAQIKRNTADLQVLLAEMQLKNAEARINQPQL